MHPTPRPDRELLAPFAEDLTAFSTDAVRELIGPVAQAALDREQPVPARLAVRRAAGSPTATLLALFVLGLPVTRRDLDRALPGTGVRGARELGLVRARGQGEQDEVLALVDLRPCPVVDASGTASWWVVSDRVPPITGVDPVTGDAPSTGGALRTDHVPGVGGASRTLAGSTPRRPARRVLDLGTGCGAQALQASRHAASVVGTDLSARALRFARFTWELNVASTCGAHLELRRGDLLEPVAGERFDLVVSNPPFVITPRVPGVPAYGYRDGGLEGDEVTRRLVTGLGGVLEPGGVGVALGNWEHRRGVPWRERAGAWLEESGLDGWIVQRELQDPAQYVEMWLRDARRPSGGDRDRLYEVWLEDLERRGVEGIGFGLVVLRCPAGRGRARLHRVEEVRSPLPSPVGEHLARCLQAWDWLADHRGEGLLGARLRRAQDVTEERAHRPGQADPHTILLRQGQGFGRSVLVSTASAALVGACDGDLTVGRLLGALGQLLSVPAGELAAQVLPAVEGLVSDGFLVPADR